MPHRFENIAILSTTMVTAALVFGDFEFPLRTAFALAFMSVVPGYALVRLIGVSGLAMRLFLAVPISLAISMIVSGGLVYAGIVSWNFGVTIIMSVTVGAVILDISRRAVAEARVTQTASRRLTHEDRQERLIGSLREGSTLAEAARVADVSLATVYREMRRSDAFRRAIDVASGGLLTIEGDGDVLRETRIPHHGQNPTRSG